MANELILPVGETGLTVYAVLTNSTAQVWNGATAAFEDYVDAHWADYAIPSAEAGLSGRYAASMPSAPAGVFGWTMYEQQGPLPAIADSAYPAGTGDIQWDGTEEATLVSRLPASAYVSPDNAGIAAIQARTDNLPANPAAVGSAMSLDMTQAVPITNVPQTVGDALNAARAEGFGPWSLDVPTRTMTLFAADGTTPVHSFTWDDAENPTSRN